MNTVARDIGQAWRYKAEFMYRGLGRCTLFLAAMALASCAPSRDRSGAIAIYNERRQEIESNLNSGDWKKNADVLRLLTSLQSICYIAYSGTPHSCSTADIEARYNENRIAFAKNDPVCRKHLGQIERRDAIIGAPYKCTILAIGMPNEVHTTRTSYGTSQQLIYAPGWYVYVRNGNVQGEQR